MSGPPSCMATTRSHSVNRERLGAGNVAYRFDRGQRSSPTRSTNSQDEPDITRKVTNRPGGRCTTFGHGKHDASGVSVQCIGDIAALSLMRLAV